MITPKKYDDKNRLVKMNSTTIEYNSNDLITVDGKIKSPRRLQRQITRIASFDGVPTAIAIRLNLYKFDANLMPIASNFGLFSRK